MGQHQLPHQRIAPQPLPILVAAFAEAVARF